MFTKVTTLFWIGCLFASGVLHCSAEEEPLLPPKEKTATEEAASAVEILNHCAQMIPHDRILLNGILRVRRFRGFTVQENPYKLMLDWGASTPSAEILLMDPKGETLQQRAVMTRPAGKSSQLSLFDGPEQKAAATPTYAGRILGTDMTWLDLSLDFLWWKQARFDDPAEGESRNGRDCHILLTTPPAPIPGCAAMRVWIDKKLRCIMQAEQLGPQGNATRRLWVQRVKKWEDRWMIRDMEIESIGSGHRTQLLVEEVQTIE